MPKKNKTRVNVKARLDRHLRIVKENIGTKSKTKIDTNYHYNIVLFFILAVIPFYPTLASFVHNTSQVDFYRGNIDESSIIESYFGGDTGGEQIGGPILEASDSFISVNTILDDKRDLEGTNEIVEYEIKPGESFYSISYKFKVSTSSIYWANNFSKKHILRPGEIIKVPPVSGLIHQVKKGDTVSSIAKKYDIEEKKIITQNVLESTPKLIVGEVLVIPGAVKKAPPKPKPKPRPTYIAKTSTKGGHSFTKGVSSQYTSQTGKYKLVWRKPYSGAWGNCTYYVASYKNVNWRGNANRWLQNARAKGHKTGNTPTIGAVVTFEGRGYNPRYGHVAIVMDIKGDSIIVSEMNYRRINEVTYRKVAINDKRITGYIYIN